MTQPSPPRNVKTQQTDRILSLDEAEKRTKILEDAILKCSGK